MTGNRCPFSRLTRRQAHYLMCVVLGHEQVSYVPHGVVRALIIRGILNGRKTVTDTGIEALRRCQFYSPTFVNSALERRAA